MKKNKILIGITLSGLLISPLAVNAATVSVSTQNEVPMIMPGVAAPQNYVITPGGAVSTDQFNQQEPPAERPQSATNTQASQQQSQTTATEEIGNAYSQGYGEQKIDQEQELSDYLQYNSARQKGIKVEVPSFRYNWSSSRDNKVWFVNWKGMLIEKAGVPAEKVDFEARRLSKEEFNAWASRVMRASGY